MLFIPTSEGVYIPLILRQLNDGAVIEEEENETTDHRSQIVSYKNNLFLDFDTLDRKHTELLRWLVVSQSLLLMITVWLPHRECSLLMVATIKNIIPKYASFDSNNNAFGLRENESFYLLQVEAPEYILGFEDNDALTIKNYATAANSL